MLLVLHHAGEGLLHVARLIHFADQKEKTSKGKIWKIYHLYYNFILIVLFIYSSNKNFSLNLQLHSCLLIRYSLL